MPNSTSILYRQMSNAIKTLICEKTGCPSLKDYLLRQAFTRVSYTRETGEYNNEMLEWLGDSIINYYTSKKIAEYYGTCNCDEEHCGYVCRGHERNFTEIKNRIVSNKTLAEIVNAWVLPNGEPVSKYLIVGRSDIMNNVVENEKAQADLLEAIIGAIAIQCEFDPETLEKVIIKIIPFENYFQVFDSERPRLYGMEPEKAVTTLKELAEKELLPFPEYDFSGPEYLGYDKNGNSRWVCSCSIIELGIAKQVFGHSKAETKKFAAYLVLCEHFKLVNEYGPSKSLFKWYVSNGKLTLEPPEDF